MFASKTPTNLPLSTHITGHSVTTRASLLFALVKIMQNQLLASHHQPLFTRMMSNLPTTCWSKMSKHFTFSANGWFPLLIHINRNPVPIVILQIKLFDQILRGIHPCTLKHNRSSSLLQWPHQHVEAYTQHLQHDAVQRASSYCPTKNANWGKGQTYVCLTSKE